MDSLGTKPAAIDPEAPRFRERRARMRHKVHTPAYASLCGYSPGMPLDLNEILDISEDGMAVQTSSEKEIGENLNLWVDLSETAAYLHMTGVVVWSDRAGRTGIRFSEVPEISQSQLREWLFANMIAACANQGSAAPSPVPRPRMLEVENAQNAPPSSDYTEVLTALAAVKKELQKIKNRDSALQLIAERALSLTRATGAAIALAATDTPVPRDSDVMICSARSGEDAPDLGAKLQVGSGFSGECVRSGVLLRCDDSETDARVDRENCRALGIRSIIAGPVVTDAGIVGLIEVFAPQPNAFGLNESTVIRNLAEAVSSVLRPPMPAEGIGERPIELDDEVYQERDENTAKRVLPRYQIVLLVLVAITLSLVVIWLIRSEPVKSPADSGGDRSKASSDGSAVIRANAAPPLHGIDEVRRLAEQGDPSAEFAYGVHYFAGENVPQDYSEAVRWFSKAAEQNNVMAQSTLAACYWAGQGVPQDFNKAYFWAVIAQAGGDEASKSRVALLASRMNHVEVVEAQQQADEWIHQHQIARAVPPVAANESDNPGGR